MLVLHLITAIWRASATLTYELHIYAHVLSARGILSTSIFLLPNSPVQKDRLGSDSTEHVAEIIGIGQGDRMFDDG